MDIKSQISKFWEKNSIKVLRLMKGKKHDKHDKHTTLKKTS